MQRGFSSVIIVLSVLFLVTLGGAYYVYYLNTSSSGGCLASFLQKGGCVPPTNVLPAPLTPIPASADETSSWKTYTNTKMGYTIKYPEKGLVNCDDEYLYLYELNNPSECAAGEMFPYLIILDHLDGTGDVDKSSYPECYSIKSEPTIVDNVNATKYSAEIKNSEGRCLQVSNHAKFTTHVVVKRNEKIYNVIYYSDGESEQTKQILSTFKFTQ